MPNQLYIFDLDHTLLRVNSSYAFGKYLYSKGILSSADMLYMFGCYWRHKLLGLSIFDVHHKIFSRFFRGKSLAMIESAVAKFLDLHLESMIYRPAYDRLMQACRGGHPVFILSSSPQFIVGPISDRFGVTGWESSYYAVDKDQCLCHISRLVEGKEKAISVTKIANGLGIDRGSTIAYTDSQLDLPLLHVVDHIVGVNPDRLLRKVCQRNGWEIL